MITKNIFAVAAVGVISLLMSCAKVGPTGPTGPAGPTFTGSSLTGHLFLYDKYGSPILSGYSKASLVLTGPLVTAMTLAPDAATGAFTYAGVKTNTFTLNAADSGYGATRLDNINFVSGTLYQDVSLSAIPDSFITSFSADKSVHAAFDSLMLRFSPDDRGRQAIVFVNNSRTIGSTPPYYLLHYVVSLPAGASSAILWIPKQDLTNAGLASSSQVYFAAYSYVVNDASVYQDVTTGKKVFNAVNPIALIDSALVP